jgi:hypothetical protein
LSPFSVCGVGSPLDPGLPHPVRSAHRVFHPLSGFLLPKPPGFFSPRNALGILPSEPSLPKEREHLSAPSALLPFIPRTIHGWQRASLPDPSDKEAWYVGFRAFFPLGVRSRGSGGLARPVVGALLGFLPLQGLVSLYDVASLQRSLLSCGPPGRPPRLLFLTRPHLPPRGVGSRFAVPGPLQSFSS